MPSNSYAWISFIYFSSHSEKLWSHFSSKILKNFRADRLTLIQFFGDQNKKEELEIAHNIS